MYEYKAKVIDIYDGDTMTVEIDLGFNLVYTAKIRLAGINTPEIRTSNWKEKKLGLTIRDYLRTLFLNKDVIITTEKKGKFGRYIAEVFFDDININNQLVSLGYAKIYDGGKRGKWFDE